MSGTAHEFVNGKTFWLSCGVCGLERDATTLHRVNPIPLNPDALENAYAKYAELSVEEWRTRPHSAWRERVIEDVNIAVSAYLEVAQPEVDSFDPRELEAEALELYRTFYGTDVLWVDVFKKETWLAVARRARELSGRVAK